MTARQGGSVYVIGAKEKIDKQYDLTQSAWDEFQAAKLRAKNANEEAAKAEERYRRSVEQWHDTINRCGPGDTGIEELKQQKETA